MDLIKKTIFDFTDDKELIQQIISVPKDYYLECAHVVNKMNDIISFAILINNDVLKEEAEKAFKEVKRDWENTVKKGAKRGLIVD